MFIGFSMCYFSGHLDGGSFAKLFIGSVPRTATEENVSQLK